MSGIRLNFFLEKFSLDIQKLVTFRFDTLIF